MNFPPVFQKPAFCRPVHFSKRRINSPLCFASEAAGYPFVRKDCLGKVSDGSFEASGGNGFAALQPENGIAQGFVKVPRAVTELLRRLLVGKFVVSREGVKGILGV